MKVWFKPEVDIVYILHWRADRRQGQKQNQIDHDSIAKIPDVEEKCDKGDQDNHHSLHKCCHHMESHLSSKYHLQVST